MQTQIYANSNLVKPKQTVVKKENNEHIEEYAKWYLKLILPDYILEKEALKYLGTLGAKGGVDAIVDVMSELPSMFNSDNEFWNRHINLEQIAKAEEIIEQSEPNYHF